MRYLICYDIADDRKREHLSKTLLNYGQRIQESVFAADLDEPLAAQLIHKLTAMMVTHSMHQAANLGDRLIMMQHGRVIHDLRGAEKKRVRPEELLARFEEIRREEQLDETAAEMLQRSYV